MREQLRTTRLTNLSPEANRRAEKEQLGPVQYKPSAYPPQSFPIGTANQPWGDSERAAWLALHSVKRSYQAPNPHLLLRLPSMFGPISLISMLPQTSPSTVCNPQEEVLDKLALLKDDFDMQQYGALSYDPERYPALIPTSLTLALSSGLECNLDPDSTRIPTSFHSISYPLTLYAIHQMLFIKCESQSHSNPNCFSDNAHPSSFSALCSHQQRQST